MERVSLSGGPREYVASDYPEILKRWTRDESLINVTELETPLTVTATFETWDFRWAYVVRYAQDYRLTVEQRRALLEQTLQGVDGVAPVLRRPLRLELAVVGSHAPEQRVDRAPHRRPG